MGRLPPGEENVQSSAPANVYEREALFYVICEKCGLAGLVLTIASQLPNLPRFLRFHGRWINVDAMQEARQSGEDAGTKLPLVRTSAV